MRIYIRIIVSMLLMATSPAWCADPPDFRDNWMKLFKAGDPRERSMAIEHLGFPDCRTKEGMAYLRLLGKNGVQDSSPLVRETALARIRFTLSPDHHGGCRADDELIATLLNALKDPSPGVREGSLRILGITKTSRALTEISALLNDGEFTVRQQAAVALGRIGDSQALPLLLDLLTERKEWQDAFVQQEALYSIRKIVAAHHKTYIYRSRSGDKREEKFNIDADLLEKVKTAMIRVADDPWLRREAFEFFAAYATTGARNNLRSAANDTDPVIRKMAYDGISRLDAISQATNNCGYDNIALALKDQTSAIRAAALAKLSGCRGQVDNSILSAHLVNGINDTSQEVSAAAVAAASTIDGVYILKALVGKFGVEPYETRKKVMEAFLNIALSNQAVAVPASTESFVKRKISRPRGDTNVIIVQALEGVPPAAQGHAIIDGRNKRIIGIDGQENTPESHTKTTPDKKEAVLEAQAVEIILNRFSSLSVTGKITALEALEKLNDKRIRPFAISLLDDPLPRVRSNAIILASKFGTESMLPQLFRCAQDKDSDLRYSAVRSLIEIEKLPEEYSLVRLAESTDPAVRDSLANEIQQYLVRHNDKIRPDLKYLIEKMLDDPDFNIRQKVSYYFRDSFDNSSIGKLAMILDKDGVCSNAAFALAAQGDARGNDALYEVGKGACDSNKVYFNPGKMSAATALSKAKDPRATRLLCDMLEEGKGDDYQLVIQLGATYDKSAAPCLVTYGKKRKHGREVMSALRKTASPEALDFLKESLDTYQYDYFVAQEAIAAIAATPGTRSLDILIEEIRNNSNFTNNMIDMLGNRAMRDNEALSYLFKIAGKEQQALGKISVEIGFKAAPVIPWQKQVMTLADDKDRNVRTGAIIALGSFHDGQSLSLLEKLAAGNDKELAALAQQSLEIRSKRKQP